MADQTWARILAEMDRRQAEADRKRDEMREEMRKEMREMRNSIERLIMNSIGQQQSVSSPIQEAWEPEAKPTEEMPEVIGIKAEEPLGFVQAKEKPKKPLYASSESPCGSNPAGCWSKKRHRRLGPNRWMRKFGRGKTKRPQSSNKFLAISDEEPMGSFQKNHFFSETHYKPDYEDPSRRHCSSPIGREISHCGRPPEYVVVSICGTKGPKIPMASRWRSCRYRRKPRFRAAPRAEPRKRGDEMTRSGRKGKIWCRKGQIWRRKQRQKEKRPRASAADPGNTAANGATRATHRERPLPDLCGRSVTGVFFSHRRRPPERHRRRVSFCH